jgi:nucleoside-diphosphate-sugar epimerase
MARRHCRMIFIVGANGRLGQALVRRFGASAVTSLPRSVYANWHEDGAAAAVARYFASVSTAGDTIYVCAGLLDPHLPELEHRAVNLALPCNIIAAATPLGIAVRTFGTVMEVLMPDHNPYIRSKAALGHQVARSAAAGLPVAHLRLHTQYGGGAPSAFMFLGQIASALRARAPFMMTSGRQLREYHHVDDDAAAIDLLETAGLQGVQDLNHGAPVTLAALAQHVFATFNASDLLALGALPEPATDNFGRVLDRLHSLGPLRFRATLPGVTDYLKTELQAPKSV